MSTYIIITVITAVVFLAMILNLAAKPAFTARITKIILFCAVAGGFVFYGYGFAATVSNPVLAVMRAILSVCSMFVGGNSLSAIEQAPGMNESWILTLFWIVHICALYTSASAAITRLGDKALGRLRMAMSKKGELVLIYGTSAGALDFGRECARKKGVSVLFVSPKPLAGDVTAIEEMGAVLRSDTNSVDPNLKFLKSIGMKKGSRKMFVYCMDRDGNANYIYAEKLKNVLKEAGIEPGQLSLVLMGEDESMAASLQAYKNEYGYGNASMFRIQDQAARLAIRKCPPWNYIRFDENGKALDDFHVLLVGFGTFGQSLLRYLVMNGQFYGSHFKLTVISKECEEIAGYIKYECPGIFENYDIEIVETDARGPRVFEYIEKNKEKLKYIAVSIGDEKTSQEVSGQLRQYLSRIKADIPVVQCSVNGIYYRRPGKSVIEKSALFTGETLDYKIADLYAMVLNHKYASASGQTMWQDWMECDHFSRMSSRASTDFIPAMLKIMKTDPDTVSRFDCLTVSDHTDIEQGIVSAELAENLGRTEHERWCAFHYAMGFAAMTDEEWKCRAAVYEKQSKDNAAERIRISKDMDNRVHACLVPWEKLDELSERENKLTGKNTNYKQLDINNVLEIPAVLKSSMGKQNR